MTHKMAFIPSTWITLAAHNNGLLIITWLLTKHGLRVLLLLAAHSYGQLHIITWHVRVLSKWTWPQSNVYWLLHKYDA